VKSVGQKIAQIEGLLGTAAANAWELEFIESIAQQTDHGRHTTRLTENQVEKVDQIYGRHFA
jgi:hypothetical protein